MPIDYRQYPADWPDLSRSIRIDRSGGRCECAGECGVQHCDPTPGTPVGQDRCPARNGDRLKGGRKVVLTVAHLCRPEDHDPPAKCGDETHLLALCQSCHLRLDRPEHVRHARENRAKRQGVQELPFLQENTHAPTVQERRQPAHAPVAGDAPPAEPREGPPSAGLQAQEPPAVTGPMPAISLWQPWATLIVIGAKRIETRDWPAPRKFWGQRIAIHAAKHWTREEHEIASEGYFIEALRTVPGPNVPRGCVVGTVILVRCVQIIGEPPERPKFGTQEHAFGNYEEGRWMWLMSDPIRFERPIPCVGRQGFFTWTPESYPQQGDSQHGVSREPVGGRKPARGATLPMPEHDALRSAVEFPADATPRGEARDLPSPSPPTLNQGEQGAAVGADGGQPDSGGPPAPLVALSDGSRDVAGFAPLSGTPLPPGFRAWLPNGWTQPGPVSVCASCGNGCVTADPIGTPRHISCGRAAGVAP